jgi:MATE family multidrug resistance protein
MAGSTITGATLAAASPSIWRAEYVGTIRLALPMALTQLGQVAMMTTDLAPPSASGR